MTDATPGREPPEPDDVRVTCHACGELRPLAGFRAEYLANGDGLDF